MRGAAETSSLPARRIGAIQRHLNCEPASPTMTRGNPLRELEDRLGPAERLARASLVDVGDLQIQEYSLDTRTGLTPRSYLSLAHSHYAIASRHDTTAVLLTNTSRQFLLRNSESPADTLENKVASQFDLINTKLDRLLSDTP